MNVKPEPDKDLVDAVKDLVDVLTDGCCDD